MFERIAASPRSRSPVRRLGRENAGATATEYAFLVAFVAIVAAAGMSVLGINLRDFYGTIGAALSEAECAMPDTASERGEERSNKCKDR